MATIAAAISIVNSNNFKRHYLRNKRLFLFFIEFLKCAWNLEHFEKKDEYRSIFFSEIIDTETRGYLKV